MCLKSITDKLKFFVYIGFFAGLIWGALKIAEYGLKFTKVSPGFLLEPFYKHQFLSSWLGMGMGWVAFIIMSVVAAVIYGFALRRIKGPWLSLAYGLVWWMMIYVIVGPRSGMVPSIQRLDRNSFYSDLCLFLMWGLFIGYSIVVEYTDNESAPNRNKSYSNRS
jgi:uncharacterized membrane protein YagU involved in acid resistance